MAVTENDLLVGPLVPALGVTTISLDFYFEQAEWLEVYKGNSETPLVLGTDYTVSGEGTTSGVVTLATAANGTDTYAVYLAVPLKRSSDMQLRGEFKSDPFNIEMDRIWQAIQGLDARLRRTVSLPRTAIQDAPLLPDYDQGRVLLWGPGGNITNGQDADDFVSVSSILAQANAAAAAAAVSRDDAAVAARAAGAPLFSSIADGLAGTSSGDVFIVQTEPGAAVYENDGGSEVFIGWIGELIYDDVSDLLGGTETGFSTGQIIRTRKEGFAYEVVASGEHVSTAGGVNLIVLPGPRGYNLMAFGAVGDGVADDATAIQAWLDAIPSAGMGFAPFGGYRFTSALTRENPIRITSDGAEFIPDIDALTDAITIGPASGSQYNYELTGFQIVTSSGTSNKCKDGLVVRKAQQAKVDVRVNAACAGYGLRMSGIVWADVRYLTGYTNTSFTSSYVRPQNGLFIDYDGVNQANAGRYWFNIELCANKGLVIENQVNGGQTVYSGSIGYCGGNMLEVTAVQGAAFDSIYFESNTTYNIVLDQVNFCSMRNWKRGQNGAILTMTDCSFNTFEGGQHRGEADWTMDADCVGNRIDNIDLQGGALTGSSGTYTRWGAGVQNTNLAGTPAFAPGGDDMVNYASNSNFERFTADRPAGGWNKPGAATYTQTGTGKADTTNRIGRYAAKISATTTTAATFTPDNKAQLIEHMRQTGYVSVKLPVYFPNTAENVASTAVFQLRTRIVSTAAGNTDYFSTVDKTLLDAWQELYVGGLRVPGDVTDIQFSLFIGDAAQNPTVIYVADFSIVPSPVAVRDYWPEPGNAGHMAATAGLLALSDGVTAPTTLPGHAQIYIDTADGDLKIKFGDGTVKTIATDT